MLSREEQAADKHQAEKDLTDLRNSSFVGGPRTFSQDRAGWIFPVVIFSTLHHAEHHGRRDHPGPGHVGARTAGHGGQHHRCVRSLHVYTVLITARNRPFTIHTLRTYFHIHPYTSIFSKVVAWCVWAIARIGWVEVFTKSADKNRRRYWQVGLRVYAWMYVAKYLIALVVYQQTDGRCMYVR